MESKSPFGVLHMPSGNFLDFRATREEAEAVIAEWRAAEPEIKDGEFEIVEFDSKGMPVD